MNSGMILGLDIGERRIGVAVASSVARLPAPHSVLDRTTVADVFKTLTALIEEVGAETVVIGLPRDMKGQDTAQTAASREFARQLRQSVQVPIVLQDEAVTSYEAEARLKNRGKPYTKGDIDAEAATMILDDYLQVSARSVA